MGRTGLWGCCAAAAWLLGPGTIGAWAQQPVEEAADGQELIDARVRGVAPGGGVLIDRGTRDGVAVGDRVVFQERGGGERFGQVIEVEGRTAVVRPEAAGYAPDAGTRTRVTVPASRFAEEPAEPAPPVVTPAAPADSTEGTTPERAPSEWSREDDDWSIDMPLLAEVRAVAPWRRPPSYSGRVYTSWDRIIDSEAERGDSFLRTGGSLVLENGFGRGGVLHFDGEWNDRRSQIPFDNDESDRTLRIDRLSYTLGGNRHQPTRLRVGRFLQDDMPEFGILDGVSWSERTREGDSYGASIGFIPEPNKDQESFDDAQIAAWYRWVADERERFTVTTGYQRTWFDGGRDRDLVVARMQYAPPEGWQLFSTAFVDLRDPQDDATFAPTLSYFLMDARRDLGERSGVTLDVRHQESADLFFQGVRAGGPPPTGSTEVDRASASLWRWVRTPKNGQGGLRAWGRVGAWNDDEDSGGDGEVGMTFHDTLRGGDRVDLVGFASEGKFSSLVGGRVRYGSTAPWGGWSLMYELRQNDVLGFDLGNDELIQHRVRGSLDMYSSGGTSASLNVEAQLQDLEDQVFIGLFLQRSF